MFCHLDIKAAVQQTSVILVVAKCLLLVNVINYVIVARSVSLSLKVLQNTITQIKHYV